MIGDEKKDILTKFGAHLEALRKQQKLSLRKLASRCDVEYADIKRYENGEINPTLITVVELAKGLGIQPKEMMDY
jgi:transcriptional regulator with XRE-family HTH domain